MHRSRRVFAPQSALRRCCTASSIVLAFLAIAVGPRAVAQPVKPNVILFLADDASYDDFGFSAALNNAPFSGSTPNLDALATKSVVAREGYASPLCSPTRVGLLTGLSQA